MKRLNPWIWLLNLCTILVTDPCLCCHTPLRFQTKLCLPPPSRLSFLILHSMPMILHLNYQSPLILLCAIYRAASLFSERMGPWEEAPPLYVSVINTSDSSLVCNNVLIFKYLKCHIQIRFSYIFSSYTINHIPVTTGPPWKKYIFAQI